MSYHPDAYRGSGPADRVRAFLDARAGATGLDPEQLLSYGTRGVVYELNASDLRAVLGEPTITVVTADGLVHNPAGAPSGPTTACGRAEQVYVIKDEATCPECRQRRSDDTVRMEECTCLPYPYGDGPEIDCPRHGA